jgi:hypothetical protein
MRGVSKHAGAANLSSSSFETRARAFELLARSRTRAPQDEDDSSSSSTQPFAIPRRDFRAGLLHLSFAHPE